MREGLLTSVLPPASPQWWCKRFRENSSEKTGERPDVIRVISYSGLFDLQQLVDPSRELSICNFTLVSNPSLIKSKFDENQIGAFSFEISQICLIIFRYSRGNLSENFYVKILLFTLIEKFSRMCDFCLITADRPVYVVACY